MIAAVVFDLDGVIRHFDDAYRADVERRHGLDPESLWRAAFSPPHIDRLVTGQLTRAEWVQTVGELIGNQTAAIEWLSAPGAVDNDMRELLTELQDVDVAVALLTNGTDTIDAELQDLGLDSLLDLVFNTHYIGHRKPTPEIYRHVGRELGAEPEHIWFTDDSSTNVEGALAVGWQAEQFTSPAAARSSLVSHDLFSQR